MISAGERLHQPNGVPKSAAPAVSQASVRQGE